MMGSTVCATRVLFSVSRYTGRVAPVPVTFPNHNEGAPGPSQLGTGVDVR